MVTSGRPGSSPVVFDESAWAADLDRYAEGSRARAVAAAAREEFERDGVPLDVLLACEEEGTDGTRLAGHVKVYLPLGDQAAERRPFGMVFALEFRGEQAVLAYAAFGVRHQPRGSRAPTVYAIAHLRRHGSWP